eukprot:10654816-Alexandrium_andersonii.AAC.1
MSCMHVTNSGKKSIGDFQGNDGRERAMKWGRTLRAKAGVLSPTTPTVCAPTSSQSHPAWPTRKTLLKDRRLRRTGRPTCRPSSGLAGGSTALAFWLAVNPWACERACSRSARDLVSCSPRAS